MKKTLFLALSVCFLAACSQEQESTPKTDSTDSAAVVSTQVLNSQDKKMTLPVPYGQFVEQNVQDNIITYRDEANNITVQLAQFGKTEKEANQYFSDLSAAIQSDKTLSDVQIGEAKAGRLHYQFSQKNGEAVLHENCVALFANQNIYSACTGSSDVDQESLSTFTQAVQLDS